MFQLQFTKNGETQTLGYPTLNEAIRSAEEIYKSLDTSQASVLDATNPDDIVVVMSWSRG